jgi:glycosyltransferase involved in cell wall biosynthesis
MKKSLAILITYYNEKELLGECLNSLAVQQVLPDEVWIYDDCARFPAVDYLPENLPFQVEILRSEVNRKPAYGRNLLMQKTTCEYVHCHDSDDLFEPHYGEKIRAFIEGSSPDVILHETRIVRDGVTTSTSNFFGETKVRDLQHLISLSIGGAVLPANITYKRELALQVGGYLLADVLPQSEDYEFHVRLLNAAKSFEVSYEPLTVQRVRSDSHSSTNQDKVYISGYSAIEILAHTLPDVFREDLGERAAYFGMTLYRMGQRQHAKNAFSLAKRLGATHKNRNSLHRHLSLLMGQEVAEAFSLRLQKMKAAFGRAAS